MTCQKQDPATEEHFEWEDFRFEVVDMDGTEGGKASDNKYQDMQTKKCYLRA